MEIPYRILCCVLELFAIGSTMTMLFHYQIKITYSRLAIFISGLVGFILFICLTDNYSLVSNASLFICMLGSSVLLQSKFKKKYMILQFITKALQTLLVFVVLGVVQTLILLLIYGTTGYSNVDIMTTVLLDVILVFIILIILIVYIRRGKYKEGYLRGNTVKLFATLIIAFGFVMSMYPLFQGVEAYQDHVGKVDFSQVVYSFISIVFTVTGIIMLYFFTENKAYKEKEEIRRMEDELVQKYYSDILKNNEEMGKIRHDYKGHISAMEYLCEKRDWEKLEQYVAELKESIHIQNKVIWAGNDYISAILNNYQNRAIQDNIRFSVEGTVAAAEEVVSEFDWCVILTNSLNNAIEACRLIPITEDRQIKVMLKNTGEQIQISIENSTTVCPRLNNGRPVSTKEDKLSHGFGVKNMERSIQKYDGSLYYKFDEEKMKVTVLIMLNVHSATQK